MLDIYPEDINRIPAIDLVGVKIYTSSHNSVIVFALYIPPNTTTIDYQHFFEILSSQDCTQVNDIIILGDFNITKYASYLQNSQTNGQILALNNFMSALNIHQYNYIYNQNNNILDLILSNRKCIVEKSFDALVHEDNHHPALNISVDLNTKEKLKNNFRINYGNYYNFRKANFPILYEMLYNVDWSYLTYCNDIEVACTQFYNKIYFIFDLCVPKYSSTHKNKYPPWFNYDIIKNIRIKANCWNKYKNTGHLNDLNDFKRLRSKIKYDVNTAYKSFVQTAENNIKEDPRKFWAFINGKKGSTKISRQMHFEGQVLNNSTDILNKYAAFFSQSYSNSPNDPLRNNYSYNIVNNNSVINMEAVSETEVVQAIKKIKPKMTTGPDGVPAFVIKDCAQIFAYPLSILFNLCISSSCFPSLWKRSKVCPVFKKGDKHDIANFRAISIICNFCKIFEILLHGSIYPKISNQISVHQHGFMKQRSTITNLFCITQYISESIDLQASTDVIYTDFSKAFDRLDHKILLTKLDKIGFSNSLISLFESYLLGRIQYVAFGGFKSVEYVATSGVPQGSVLGPLLFNIFVNDITESLNTPYLLYADDLKIFSVIKTHDDCLHLQSNLDKISNWCIINKLPLNPEKCSVMTYTLKSSIIKFNYNLNNVTLQRPITFRDLGVIFDKNLSFINHVDSIISSAFKTFGFIVRNSRDFMDVNTVKLLYYSLVRSKLEYAALVWYPGYQIHINNLENVQRRFLKLLAFKSDGIYPAIGFPQHDLLNRFSVASLKDRRFYISQIFLFNIIHNNIDCPEILHKLNFSIPRQNSRTMLDFYLPTPRTNVLKSSPLYTMCNNHNSYCMLDIFHCSINDIKSSLNH